MIGPSPAGQERRRLRAENRPSALAFGVIYMAVSMAIEIVLLVVVRLRIPQDNGIIAAILFLVAPAAAAVACGFRRGRPLIIVAVATVVLTVALVMVFERVTAVRTGVWPPIVIRTLAGFLAAALTNAVTRGASARRGSVRS